MIVVSDTTAITTLLKSGDEELLAKLFGVVIVPPAVWDELRAFHASLPAFIEVRPLSQSIKLAGSERLGRGEVEAMQLALQVHADWLLLDDRQARITAAKLGIRWWRSPACSSRRNSWDTSVLFVNCWNDWRGAAACIFRMR